MKRGRGNVVETGDGGSERRVPSETVSTVTPVMSPARSSGFRGRIRLSLEIIRANPTGRIALKTIVAVTGTVVVLIGLALIPLPGPGWLIVIGGLAIWAIEFHWARRLLHFTRSRVQSWTRWVGRQPLSLRFLLGAAGLVFVAAVLWLSLKMGLGIDVVAEILRYLATH